MPREFADPYLYPGTRVLRNKPGLRDEAALGEFEYEQTYNRSRELYQTPIPGPFDLDHLKAIHAHLFQDVYEWAGQLRVIRISKGGDLFAHPDFIEPAGQRLAVELAGDNHLKGLEKSSFVERLAYHYSEWNALHPFREGKGRSTREFFGQLARAAGYELDQSRLANAKDRWNQAAQRGFNGDLEGLRQLLSEAVRPRRAVAFEQLAETEALARHPELKGALAGLRAARDSLEKRFPRDEKTQQLYLARARHELVSELDLGKIL